MKDKRKQKVDSVYHEVMALTTELARNTKQTANLQIKHQKILQQLKKKQSELVLAKNYL